MSYLKKLNICLARRKGKNWFIAGINSGKERNVNITLDFMESGNFLAEVYEDKEGEEMTNIDKRNDIVTSEDTLSVRMMNNGGFCAFLDKK